MQPNVRDAIVACQPSPCPRGSPTRNCDNQTCYIHIYWLQPRHATISEFIFTLFLDYQSSQDQADRTPLTCETGDSCLSRCWLTPTWIPARHAQPHTNGIGQRRVQRDHIRTSCLQWLVQFYRTLETGC
ncbi:hypothetical protein LIA77_01265 [Sarocladium implicatum]|nr:hypothetical protein LIA77_01265 [Sarocladium implicatum]